MFFRLAVKSLLNRRGSVLLTLLAMTVSVYVLLGVEHIRFQAKENFSNTVSGVDLIVGARTGSLNLLLYSVFHVGAPVNNIQWESFEEIASNPNVKWAVPISLGDSHKGYRVMGTTASYFDYFSFGKQHKLTFAQGASFHGVHDVVIGSGVAKKLSYTLGDKVVLAHGTANVSFKLHDDQPFTVVGILKPTGTPVDNTLLVSLQGIEAIHSDWKETEGGSNRNGTGHHVATDLIPQQITAFMLGLRSRIATFRVQRDINDYSKEPMLAILPGVALSELWQMMGVVENTLFLVAILVFISALLGLSALLLSSIRERSREIYLLRAIGASPMFIFALIQLESLLITLLSVLTGAGLLSACLAAAHEPIMVNFSLSISSNVFSEDALFLVSMVVLASVVSSSIPAFCAYVRAKRVKGS